MATPAQRTNTWILDEWYDQAVAGTTGGYQWGAQLWSWGYNRDGSGALNDKTKRSSPTQVGTNTNWKFASGSKNGYRAFGTKLDGTLWAWGQNGDGELGHNDTVQRSSPIQVPGTYKYALGSAYNTFYLKEDGTLWSSGRNFEGLSGLNEADGTKRSSPAQIGTESTWKSINAGRQNAGGIKTDGTLWMWGTGSAMQWLNNGPTPGISSPSQIPGTTWKYVAFGNYSAAAVKTDGTLWMWGDNGQGTLGLNKAAPSASGASSPIQVPGTNWDLVDMASTESETRAIFATKTDGSFWVWGSAPQCMRLGLDGPGPATSSWYLCHWFW
jgi:alpha-tubulin suppressor-like RCC1 family protein